MAKRPQSALPFCCTIGMTVTTRLLFRPRQQVDRGAPTYLGLMVTAIQRSWSHTPSRCHSGAIQWFLSSPNIIWIPTIEYKYNDPVITFTKLSLPWNNVHNTCVLLLPSAKNLPLSEIETMAFLFWLSKVVWSPWRWGNLSCINFCAASMCLSISFFPWTSFSLSDFLRLISLFQ